MMNKTNSTHSDYGSGSASSSNSLSTWGSVDKDNWLSVSQLQSCLQQMSLEDAAPRAQSLGSVGSVKNKRTLEDVMLDFQMNGSDSPYDPDDNAWGTPTGKIGWETKVSTLEEEKKGNVIGTCPRPMKRKGRFAGMGPPSGYLRQKSWPEPEASPVPPLPRPQQRQDMEWEYGSTQWTDDYTLPTYPHEAITAEQMRVLQTLPSVVLYALLRDLQAGRQDKMAARMKGKRGHEECRFCKNNGERETYFRSHVLKDQSGRVQCPVLRAFVCKRCGASGDRAHTIKYCPLSTDEERILSAAMMRSVRLASGRKRTSSITPSVGGASGHDYEPTPSNGGEMWKAQPLDPVWAALEQKLMQ